MGKIKRVSTAVLAAAGLIVMFLVSLRAVASWNQGYTWQEMDWQNRGSTSIADFLAASDIGRREVIVGGRKCVEYYAYKDGLPLKTSCAS